MRNKLFLFLAIMAFSVVFIGCNNDDDTITPDKKLEITVIDNLANVQSGASVTIYKTLNDWNNNTNPVQGTKTTGTDGKVLFTGLDAVQYYIWVEKGSLNNYSTGNMTTSAIQSG